MTDNEAKIIEVREDGTIVPIKSKKGKKGKEKKKRQARVSVNFSEDTVRVENRHIDLEVDGLLGFFIRFLR